jgi:ATP-dependent Clp protease adaptor protein ClpS
LDGDVEGKISRPRIQPVHVIVVYNDDDHTFEYVIDLFAKVLHYPREKCIRLAISIHKRGKRIVWSGMKEHGEFKIEQLRNGGPDLWSVRQVAYPILRRLVPAT